MLKKRSEKKTKAQLWPNPDMSIISDDRMPPPEFPVGVFGSMADFVESAAEVKSAPPDFIAMPLLCAATSLVSNTYKASPWDGWVEPLILWCAIVGNPSSSKSPALDVVRDPLKKIEDGLAEEYKAETLRGYAERKAIAEAHAEQYQRELRKAVKEGNEPPPLPDEAREPEKPPRPRILISDTTIEKAAELLVHNGRGLCLMRDELSGFVANFERHGGSDREFYLEGFGGRPYTVDRVKHNEPLMIPALSICIVGGIQPDKLDKLLLQTEDDGLSARFIYAFPSPVPLSRPNTPLDAARIERVFQKLHSLPFAGGNEAHVLPFSSAAAELLHQWRKDYPAHEEGACGPMLSLLGKMAGIIVRVSAILTLLDWADGEKSPHPTRIKEKAVKRAIKLVDEYIIPMAWRTLGNTARPQDFLDAGRLANWILRNKCEKFNARGIRRGKQSPLRDKYRLDKALELLVECNWIADIGQRDGDTPGQKKRDFAVNPKVFSN